MSRNKLALGAVTIALAGGLAVLTTAASKGHGVRVERIDFGATPHPTTPVWDPRVTPASDAPIKEFRIPMSHDTIEIAKGVAYVGWTFGHTVPGPVLRVRQGDLVRITIVNEAADMPHSIDLHAARIPMDRAMQSVAPGDSLSFAFEATTAGVFMVHCGTPPVLMHIAQGMYLPIIVDPQGGWPTKADKEFVLVQSEFYPQPSAEDSAVRVADWNAMVENHATYVVFNGRAAQYRATPLQVDEGDRVRFFVMNAGPNRNSDFHIVGTILDAVYPDGEPGNALHGLQTYMVPAGGGAVVETSFARGYSGEGHYVFVTHAFADATKGAVGTIQVSRRTATAAAR